MFLYDTSRLRYEMINCISAPTQNASIERYPRSQKPSSPIIILFCYFVRHNNYVHVRNYHFVQDQPANDINNHLFVEPICWFIMTDLLARTKILRRKKMIIIQPVIIAFFISNIEHNRNCLVLASFCANSLPLHYG